MSYSSPPGSGSPRGDPNPDMRALLATFARYATLVRFQEAALENEDMDRFEDLAKAREAIQEEIGSGPPSIAAIDDLDSESQEYLEQVYEEFRDALLRDVRIRGMLQKMKKDATGSIKTVEGRGGQAKEYLSGEETNSGDRPSQLNIRT